ncbi:hypothetical protein C2V83_07145 [Salmonella enterica]|uniref:Uncharacterized protein n=1 Tax=Salmonella blockley TaxID=57741 RepID=A0A5Z5ZHS3_SALBL|nr:hypothetical protein [Salmonella enterica subsp. enterica serovar Blockley]EAA9614079.1 hypothetical protein [Salmonella enterica]EBH8575542.1 hypothetical protein [Salmonella enterica subsp. enterica serovar Braenderup]EBW8522539.1 hypothetical protein [Salmonella enterica subsp. enterica serovar Haardt]EBY1767967.1 hypothetical protein [Salmonella enterica subsp. enterica serovar Georgia]ECE0178360.1 hypothetical protein [Salmonella enterica subsp. enterica]
MNNNCERIFSTMSYNFSIKDEVENLKLIEAELTEAGMYSKDYVIAIYLGMIKKESNYLASPDCAL